MITDLEEANSDLLPTFPFSSLIPIQIIFEFIPLEDLGYNISVFDPENLIATHKTFTPPKSVNRGR